MKIRFSLLKKLLADHKWLITGLAAGLIPGSHPALSILGGIVGFFLDILFRERIKSRRIVSFVNSPETGILDYGETITAGEILICLELQYMEGLSSSYLKSADNRSLLMAVFGSKPEGMRILEKILEIYPPVEKPEPEKLAAILKNLLLPVERAGFIETLPEILPGEGVSAMTGRIIGKIGKIWSIPAKNLPEGLLARKENENVWRILGLPPGSPPDEIRKSYRRLSGQFHPDTAGGLSPEQKRKSEEAFLKIQKAYDYLMGN